MFDLGLVEQRRYLSRLMVLLNGSAEDAEDICEDAEKRPHLLDKISIAHVNAYDTAAALRSKESLVCLESQALILQESTQPVEHSHAGVKRGQRCRDQTHLEHVAMASTMRILQGERQDIAKVLPRRWRDGASELVARNKHARAKSKIVAPKAKAKAQAHGRKPRKAERRPRKRSLRQAWSAMNVQGRLVVADDHEEFERAILDPEVRRQCEHKAAELTALARLGHAGVGVNASEFGAPRRRHDRRLRELREKTQKIGTRWDLQRARRVLNREDQQSYRPYCRRQLRTWRFVRKSRRVTVGRQDAELNTFAREQVLPTTLEPFGHALTPHPAHHAYFACGGIPMSAPMCLQQCRNAWQRSARAGSRRGGNSIFASTPAVCRQFSDLQGWKRSNAFAGLMGFACALVHLTGPSSRSCWLFAGT